MVTVLKTRQELKEHVKKHEVVIVKFTADWCGPCRRVAPHIHSLMETYNKINYVVVDVDEGSNIDEILPSSDENEITKFFAKTNGYVKNH
jgi:thiol-disulfide isomerase/thioredoxin